VKVDLGRRWRSELADGSVKVEKLLANWALKKVKGLSQLDLESGSGKEGIWGCSYLLLAELWGAVVDHTCWEVLDDSV